MGNIEDLGKEIIANFEESRINFDKDIKYFQEHNSNPFRTGWCSGFNVYLNDEEKTIKINISCELFGSHTKRGETKPLKTDIGTLLDSQENRAALVAILQPWLDNAVQTEEYGGFYYDTLKTYIFVESFVYGDKILVNASDEKRKEKYLANVKEFIDKEEYKAADLGRMHTNFEKLAFTIMNVFYPSISLAKVEEIFDTLESRLKESRYFDYILTGAKNALFNEPTMYENRKRKSDPHLLDLTCYICLLLIRNGQDYNNILQVLAKDYSYQKAADIIKFGSGKFAKEDVFYEDKKVSCLANDVTRLVEIKFASFDVEAYSTAITFLTKLVDIGFPMAYSIKSNVKGREYIRLSELAKTTTNKFWQSIEKYPETFPLLEEYVQATMQSFAAPYIYYADAEEEGAVPVGGYAIFVLGLYAPEKYADIIAEFLSDADYEHALTVRQFFDEVYDKLDSNHQELIEEKRYW